MKRKLKNWFAVFLALIMGLGTLTAQNTVPLNEGFSNGLPDDWVINGSGSITSEGYFKVTYGCSGYLITQKVMPTESNHTLSFDLWVCQYCNDKETNSFDLMLSTTNAEVSSFTSVLHVDGADIACAQSEGNQTIDLSNYVGQEIYLAFYITDVGNGAGIAVDNISGVSVIVPACAKPTGLAVSNITSSSAQVSWTGDAESYQLSYAVTGEDDYTTTTVSGNTYTIPSLDANTNYTVEIKSICGSDLSAAATTTFKTECAAISVAETPYTTSFEDDATGSGTVPACWTKVSGSSSPYVYTSSYSNYARTGSKTLYWSYNTNPVALPEFVENVQDLQISFFARGGSYYDGGGSMEVGVMTDPTDAETFTSLATITTAYSSYPEEAYVVRFNEYIGDGHYIAMRPTTSSSYYVDDVTVKEIPSCLEPTGLAVSDITSSSAQVSWTGDAESYQLSYAVTGEDDYTTTTVSGNTYTIPSLDANTNYTVEIKSICGSDLSDAANTTFKTACGTISVLGEAYTMDFDNVATNSMPDCWNKIIGYGSYPYVVSGNAVSGNSLQFNSYTYQYAYVILPAFAESLSDLQMVFSAKAENASNSGNLVVGLMTDPSDASTFETVETITASNTSYQEYTINFSYEGTDKYIAIRQEPNTNNYYWWIDDLTVREKPSCLEPTTVAVSGVTSSTAVVTWVNDQANTEIPANVQYTLATDNDWADAITLSNVSGTNVSIEDLAANTQYKVRVQTICGPENLSAWRESTIFKTLCSPTSVAETPYTTSFEDDETGSGTVPACWTKVSGSSSPYVYTSSYSNYARTGSKTLYWSYNTNPVALPEFVEDVKDLQLLFFARGGAYSGSGSMEVGVMTDPADASTFVPVATITTAYSSYPEEANVVRFKSYAGEGQYIAMRPATSSSYYVDDVTVELAPTCFEPENIVASSITTTSATITWEDESESTAWTLEYKKASETEYTAIEGLTEKTYNLPSLDVNTIYNVRVTGNCVGGETVSDVFTFSTSALNVTAIPFTENFEESNSYVQLSGTGTNQWFVGNATATVDGENSLYVSNDGGENNAYTHSESNAYAVMNIEFGDADEYFLSFDWKSRGESASWDRLMVFLMDENEDLSTLSSSYTTGRIFNQSTFTADPTWQNAIITLNDVQNTTKKLVFYWYNDGSGGNNPPAAIDNITIAECVAPSDVVVSNITANTADLVWNDLGGSNTWTVEYKKANEESWTTVSGQTTTAYAFEDLRPNTSYEVRVVGNCNATKYSDVAQFTTLCLPTASEREATICDNETYTDADFTLTAENEGINEIVLQNQYGCDSTITLTLTVNPTYAPVFDVVICEGESYAFNGQSYTEAGTYTASLQTINGCDSVVTLNLSVTPLNNQTFNATICEGETYNENGFMANESGTYTREVVENGCTSIWTLNLTVLPVYAQTISATICEGESYAFNGQSYTEAGTYTASLQTINGCDSVVTLNLSVTPLNNQTFNATICAGEIYNQNGFMANESGTYTREVVENGCTSTWTLNLTVLPLQTETIDETICYGETFTYNGQTYSQTGTYTTVVEGEDGACNTEVTINLVVRDANADIDELVVLNNADLPYTFMGNEYTDYGTYVVTVQDENGCEQVYNLTIQHNSGLNAVESNVLVSVYPNPTIDNATLRVEGLTEDATVVVTDQTGRMISSERLALGQTEMTINSASLAEGVYYIRIITSNSTRTEKLIRR